LWQVGRGARGASVRLPTRPLLSSNSHGYREIFIPSRWAPVATEAEHTVTTRKPSHPRDKDRSIAYLDAGLTAAIPRDVDFCCGLRKSRRNSPARAAGDLGPPPGMLAEDPDHRTREQKKEKESDRYLPLGVCSGSSRTLASRCH
jgi:hypothetical protein